MCESQLCSNVRIATLLKCAGLPSACGQMCESQLCWPSDQMCESQLCWPSDQMCESQLCSNVRIATLLKCANRNFAQMCESQLCSNVRIAASLAFRSNVRIQVGATSCNNMSNLHNHGTGRATGAVCRHQDDKVREATHVMHDGKARGTALARRHVAGLVTAMRL
jgi:hypothetical protein